MTHPAAATPAATSAPPAGVEERPVPAEWCETTRHVLPWGQRELRYTAHAGTLHLRDEEERPTAEVFHVAYTAGEEPDPRRPLTFCFNGGPGSSSVWLHLGAFGPERVEVPDADFAPPPPYPRVPNQDTLLPATDLVFVDPVGTGLSRPVGKGKLEDFTGVREDLAAMGQFVRRFLTRHRRWNSPRVLAGESYGGTRVAGLAASLAEAGVALNGVVLISAALDLGHLEFQFGNLLPSALFLPSYVAAAHHHGLTPAPGGREALLAEAATFALDEYLPALLYGARLPERRRAAVLARLVALTGLTPEFLERNALRLTDARVMKELLRARGLSVGRFDARYTGREPDVGAAEMVHDPSHAAIGGAFAAVIHDYLPGVLGVKSEREYVVLSRKVHEAWKWQIAEKDASGGFVNVVHDLRRALLANPHLGVFFANGLYDLATPYFANELAAAQLGTEPSLQARVRSERYEAGHMMYLRPDARARLSRDLSGWLEQLTAR